MTADEPKRAGLWSNLDRVWGGFTAWLRGRSRAEVWSFAAIAFSTLCVVGFAGLVLGYIAAEQSVPGQVKDAVRGWITGMRGPQDARPVERTTINSSYHVVEVSRLPVGRAWSLAEIDGGIVFSSRLGRLGYVTPALSVVSLNLDVPMNVDALRTSEIGRNPLFELSRFRVTDILTAQTGSRDYDLYVAYNVYDPDNCIRVAVSRVPLRATEASIEAAAPDWDQIYRSRDCIRPKAQGEFFGGTESGGRLERLDANRLALSVGNFQFDGVNSEHAVSMDPASDLGKIVEITLSTGRARVLASGLRNPQGLLMTRAGMLLATDHGPRGGDELNVIRDGANYGWPLVTYGLRYANRPVNWPRTSGPSHQGYEHPLFVFVPSIGISNLIEADAGEFPNWAGDLLVGSLRRNTLFRLRLVDGHVIFSEPILFEGVVIRDVIQLADGRIALAADDGDIRILSNAETPERHTRHETVSGILSLPAALPDETGDITDPARQGAVRFGLYCSQCHSVNGDVRIGPPLDGVIGRRVGGFPGYEYSEALGSRSENWTRDRLRRFASDPQAVYPGAAMERSYANEQELNQIIQFLASREAAPSREGAQ